MFWKENHKPWQNIHIQNKNTKEFNIPAAAFLFLDGLKKPWTQTSLQTKYTSFYKCVVKIPPPGIYPFISTVTCCFFTLRSATKQGCFKDKLQGLSCIQTVKSDFSWQEPRMRMSRSSTAVQWTCRGISITSTTTSAWLYEAKASHYQQLSSFHNMPRH